MVITLNSHHHQLRHCSEILDRGGSLLALLSTNNSLLDKQMRKIKHVDFTVWWNRHTSINAQVIVYYWTSARSGWWLGGKESACQCRRCGFDPWVGKILWKGKLQPIPVFLPGKFNGQRSLAGYSPWGCKIARHKLVTKQQQWQNIVYYNK